MIDLHKFIGELEKVGDLKRITAPHSPEFEVAHTIAQHDGQPLLFETVTGYPEWRIVSGYVAQREHFARVLGCTVAELVPRMAEALAHPQPTPTVDTAPCQEHVELDVDLDRIPIPRYHPQDGGPYITTGVAVVHDPEYGRNISFHRLMRIGKDRLVGRIVEGRGTHTAWK